MIRHLPLALLSGLSLHAFSQNDQRVPLTRSTGTDDAFESRVVLMSSAEERPHFPGGEPALNLFLCKHLRYPKAEARGIHGTVLMTFELDTAGAIAKVRVHRGVPDAPDLDAEAERVVKAMPHWIPARNGGRPVRATLLLPVAFEDQRDPPPVEDDGSPGPEPTTVDGWITYTLPGRTIIQSPSQPLSDEKCDVQLRINVDMEGKVTSAIHYYSDCSSASLREIARSLAMEMHFDAKSRGCTEDEGWLTLHFPGKP